MLQRTLLRRRLTTCVFVTGCAAIGACDANSIGGLDSGYVMRAAESLGGEVTAAGFLVPAGQVTRITSDLTIHASGNVEIAGDLVADESSGDGFGITIIAEGNVIISGRVETGAGAPGSSAASRSLEKGTGSDGHHAGPLVIRSNGDIYTDVGSHLVTGDGGDGSDGTFGGSGGAGGTITLQCRGTLTMLGDLTLGRGGHGGSAFTTVSTLPPEGRFTNMGGVGGALAVSAAEFDWPHLDIADPTLYVFDTNAYNNASDVGTARGSHGGRGGTVAIYDDAVAPITNKTWARLSASSDPPADCPIGSLCMSAASGGWGFALGGEGGDISVSATKIMDNGDTQSWVARGGDGGGVDENLDLWASPPPGPRFVEVIALNAQGGRGGSAGILNGPGMPGTAERRNGANGGSGIAIGGGGGNGLDLALQRGGAGGYASVLAGAGGDGYGGCAPGSGGNGGSAEAYGGSGGQGSDSPPADGGDAFAYAGPGGNGGDGDIKLGAGGVGGRWFTREGMDGSTGAPGSVTGGAIEQEGKADDGLPGGSTNHCGG